MMIPTLIIIIKNKIQGKQKKRNWKNKKKILNQSKMIAKDRKVALIENFHPKLDKNLLIKAAKSAFKIKMNQMLNEIP